MDEVLLVDGYNIIHDWDHFFDVENEPLEDCRDRLIRIMSNYQGYRRIKVILVFDAHGVKGGKTAEEKVDGLTVVYTGENETADNYIERYVYKMSRNYTIKVATSDYLQQRIVLSSGGIRMSARELLSDVLAQAEKKENIQYSVKNRKKNFVMNTVPDDVLKLLKDLMKDGRYKRNSKLND